MEFHTRTIGITVNESYLLTVAFTTTLEPVALNRTVHRLTASMSISLSTSSLAMPELAYFDAKSTPFWWPSRVIRSTQAIFRKAQDRVRSRLFHFEASGQIEGFVLSYLGTQDRALPHQPPDLIHRDEVVDYPTDFAAMSQEDIDAIALRGEQITRMLISRYVPEL